MGHILCSSITHGPAFSNHPHLFLKIILWGLYFDITFGKEPIGSETLCRFLEIRQYDWARIKAQICSITKS